MYLILIAGQSSYSVVQQRTFVSHRDSAVEVLFLHSPGCVIDLVGDAAEAIAVDFDGCK